MGHDVLVCKNCGSYVIEGRNNWECNCGYYCDLSSNYTWQKGSLKEKWTPAPIKTKTTAKGNLKRESRGITLKITKAKEVYMGFKPTEVRINTLLELENFKDSFINFYLLAKKELEEQKSSEPYDCDNIYFD